MIPYYFLGPLSVSSYSNLIIGVFFSITCEQRDPSFRKRALGGEGSGGEK